jgi:hypothetical protein
MLRTAVYVQEERKGASLFVSNGDLSAVSQRIYTQMMKSLFEWYCYLSSMSRGFHLCTT